MKTLLLDQSRWDLVLDAQGNIAAATDPYARAQDVASAVRLFSGELWYDSTKGVPYFGRILGQPAPLAFIKSRIVEAAKTVPGVVDAVCYLSGLNERSLSGQVQITDSEGGQTNVGF